MILGWSTEYFTDSRPIIHAISQNTRQEMEITTLKTSLNLTRLFYGLYRCTFFSVLIYWYLGDAVLIPVIMSLHEVLPESTTVVYLSPSTSARSLKALLILKTLTSSDIRTCRVRCRGRCWLREHGEGCSTLRVRFL